MQVAVTLILSARFINHVPKSLKTQKETSATVNTGRASAAEEGSTREERKASPFWMIPFMVLMAVFQAGLLLEALSKPKYWS